MRGWATWPFLSRKWTWAHRFVAMGFLALLVGSNWYGFAWLSGTPTATRWLGWLPFVDPLAALEVLVASRRATISMVIGGSIPLVLSLVLGRFFCGWLCPLGLLLDLLAGVRQSVRTRLMRYQIRLPEWAPDGGIKYWLLGLSVGVSALSSVPLFTTVSPINMVLLGIIGLSVPATLLLGAICLFELVAPRGFCRAVCPLGALYSLAGRFAPFRVRVRPGGKKLSCGLCTMRCPMGIRVMEDYVLSGVDSVTDPECTRCGSCADVCRGRILHLGVRQLPPASAGPGSCCVDD